MDDFEAALAAKFASAEAETTNESQPEAVAEAQAEAEAAAEQEVESQEAQPESAEHEAEAEAQPRDEKGRFVPKGEEQQEQQEERPEWLPQQFKTPEDFARSYGELQSVLGRQGQELGELRKLAEQIAAEPRQQAPPTQVAAAIEENPEAVAYWAAENGNEQVLDQAIVAWTQKAMDEGDGSALVEAQRFSREIDLARLRHDFAQEVRPSIESVAAENGKRALALARRELATQYPDFDQVMESITEAEVAGLDPNLLGQLQKTDPKAALETVYRWVAVGRTTPARVAAQDEAAVEAARQASLAEKRQATVATSSAAPAVAQKTNVEQFKDWLLEPEPHSVHHGLTDS